MILSLKALIHFIANAINKNFKRGGFYIDSLDLLKNKKAAINP